MTETMPSHPQPLQLLVGEGKNAKYVKGGMCYHGLLTFVLPDIILMLTSAKWTAACTELFMGNQGVQRFTAALCILCFSS